LKLRCTKKFKQLDFVPEAEYQIPKSWGLCKVQVIGDPGTDVVYAQF